jgi:hypothetical protein
MNLRQVIASNRGKELVQVTESVWNLCSVNEAEDLIWMFLFDSGVMDSISSEVTTTAAAPRGSRGAGQKKCQPRAVAPGWHD